MAFSTIMRILRANHVTVVGSAPLSAEEHLHIEHAGKLVCVNGSISSTSRIPDVWVLNSHHYDSARYMDPLAWSEERKALHEAMMQQSRGRSVRHVLFLLKDDSPEQTILRLREQGVTWRAYTALNPGQKLDVVTRAGVKTFSTALNISAGLFGLCLALNSGAAHVNLVGFSFGNDYAYLSSVPPDTRKHISQDQVALSDLAANHGSRFSLTASLAG